jgi:hypothetical protein
MHDTPGLQSRWWQLLKDGSDFQLWYETSAICSKGQKTNSKQGVGDVFGCVEWSFSARFAGPSWNIRMAAWKLSFVSGSRWARETPSGRLRTTGVWGSGRLAWVIPVIGNPQEEKIGLNKDTYKFEEHQGKPPTGDMKDFLDILFP